MTTITSGSSAAVTVTAGQQIAINSAPGVRCDVVATSGVIGAGTARKVATHQGGYGVYGPFGAGTVTLYAIGGNVDYDAADPLESNDAQYPVTYSPSTGGLYANSSLVSGAGNTAQVSDPLPITARAVTATGAVTQTPAVVNAIRCTAGTAVTLVLRDAVKQNLADTDTTSLQIASLTMNSGDVTYGPFEFAFGVHATVGGTSPAFSLEF